MSSARRAGAAAEAAEGQRWPSFFLKLDLTVASFCFCQSLSLQPEQLNDQHELNQANLS